MVVGVVRDTVNSEMRTRPEIYFPISQHYLAPMSVLVRNSESSPDRLPQVRRILGEIEPTMPLYNVQSFDQHLEHVFWQQRIGGLVVSLLGLLVASVGVYGILAYAVSRRRHEIGVRVSFGARRSDVCRLVLRRGLFLSSVGILCGLLLASILTRLLSSQLFGIHATDPLTFLGVAALMLLISILAGLPSALRAAQVNPVATLRCG